MSSRTGLLPKGRVAAESIRPAVPVRARKEERPAGPGVFPAWLPWIFAAKTTASALLALLVAFTFNLDQPKWALLTVFIVAQPQSGMVLAKGFYRLLGTLAGAAVALVLVALFAQQRELFLGTLALWIGLCTFASRNVRNFASYGFVLSGYTAAIIGITGALQPENVFFVAQARVTEISLGIIAAGAVSHLVFPFSLAGSLRRAVAAARVTIADYAVAVLQGHDTAEQDSRVIAEAIAIETLRASAVFEDDDIRTHSDQLRNLAAAMLGLADTAYLLGRSVEWLRRQGGGRPDVEPAGERAVEAVGRWCRTELGAMVLQGELLHAAAALPLSRTFLHKLCATDEEAIQDVTVIGRLREFFAAIVTFANAHEAALSPASDMGRPKPFYVANDRFGDAVAGLRAALALLIVGTFWILADWPSGSTTTILAAVVTARLATMEQPLRAAIGGTLVVVLATLPAFALVEVLLPQAAGFAMFSLIVAPYLFFCALLMTHKKTAGLGFIAGLYFANTAAFQDRMAYDPVGFLNSSLAIGFAIAAAALLFATVAPETPAEARRRFLRVARRLFSRIDRRVRPIRLTDFETAMTEALHRWRRDSEADGNTVPAPIEAGVALLGVGRELIRVRDNGSAAPDALVMAREAARFLAEGAKTPLERVRRAAADAALVRLRGLRADELETLEARAASRDMVAFAAIHDELERCSLLLGDNARHPAHAA